MDKPICQSCGMTMKKREDYAQNQDGSVDQEYCCYCKQNGRFTAECTMEEMVEHNLEFLEEFNKDSRVKFSREEARAEMLRFFPTLKRWKAK